MRRSITLLIICLLFIFVKAQETYTIIVSCDGFRWDFPIIYDAPTMDKLAREGVQSDMQPCYPASTFPNHYAMATGLYPDHHGIVNNQFWDPDLQLTYATGNPVTGNDPRFFLGEPIWQTAERQGVKTATIYWVGSDLKDENRHATYWYDYAKKPLISYDERVQKALEYLQLPEKERPHFIMVYFDEPDYTEHTYGPNSDETRKAVKKADTAVGKLYEGLMKLPIADKINFIVVSDHGMVSEHPSRVINPHDYLKKEWYDKIYIGIPTSIFTKPAYSEVVYNTLKEVPHLTVWKKDEIPAYLHYGTSKRLGDIIVAPEIGWEFRDTPRGGFGAHGYDPTDPYMQAIFRATGPAFKQGYIARQFENVDIYPLICHLLGIQPAECDGKLERIQHILK
ncbi:MAG: ectonucleotide pyrophosphatase/phosphodiesterase [Bacteroidaceae bacterium]|nr:ectonucleotide pyrophosphatase/phosphodiesterase [Bacteroidaceae bacterium]